MLLVKPVIEPVGESRPNADVFSELEVRLGLSEGPTEDETEALFHVARTAARQRRRGRPRRWRAPCRPAATARSSSSTCIPRTADRKVHLFPADVPTLAPGGLYSYQADPATGDRPLALISPASEKTISSTLGELRTRPAVLHMHTGDAAARGVATATPSACSTRSARCIAWSRSRDAIREGTVSLAKGLWRRSSFNQSTATRSPRRR